MICNKHTRVRSVLTISIVQVFDLEAVYKKADKKKMKEITNRSVFVVK